MRRHPERRREKRNEKRREEDKSGDARSEKERGREINAESGAGRRRLEKAAVWIKGDRGRSPPFQEPL